MKSRITFSLLLLSMFVITGCISKSLEEAQVDFCQALVAYGEAVRELQMSMPAQPLKSCSQRVMTLLMPGRM